MEEKKEVKRLVVEEITVKEEKTYKVTPGYQYSVFKDPETGKYYRPKAGFTVSGEDLRDRFIDVTDEEEPIDVAESGQ